MEQGLPWHEAAKRAKLQISQSTAYRLRQRMRQGGEQALREGRHGHPVKLRGEEVVGTDLSASSFYPEPRDSNATRPTVFPVAVSVSQINRVRVTLGVSNLPRSAKKK
jgi:hypothetical protein